MSERRDDNKSAEAEALAELRGMMRTRGTGSSFWGDTVGRVGVGQGLLMGFGDEAAAYARSLMGENYDAALAEERQRIEQTRRERPIASTAAEIGGGLLPAAGALLATPATGGASAPVAASAVGRMLATPVVRGAATGAAQGAVQGFGEGRGGVGNRLDRAGEGAVLGGAAGGVVGAVVPAARALRSHYGATPTQRAADSANRHIAADGRTAQQIADEYRDRQANLGTKPETVADVYPGSNVAGAYDAGLNRSAEGREQAAQALIQRQADAPARVVGDFEQAAERTTGTRPQSYDDVVQGAYRDRSANASPLYDRVRAYGAINDPQINEMLTRLGTSDPEVLRDATRWAARHGTDPAPLVISDANGVRLTRQPTVTDLDHLKRSLDEVIERNTDPQTHHVNPTGRWATQQRAALVNRLDEIVVDPTTGERIYAQARRAYAGPSGRIDAADLGRTAFRKRPEEITRELQNMNPDAWQAYLSGLMDAVRTRVGRVQEGNNAAVVGMSTNDRDVLRASIRAVHARPAEADQIVDGLIENVRRERQMARTKGEGLNNSATARRQEYTETEKTLGAVGAGLAADLMTTGMPGLGVLGAGVARGAQRYLGRRADLAETARSGELLRLLGGHDAASVQANMAALELRRQEVERIRNGIHQGALGNRAGVPGAIISGAPGAIAADAAGPLEPLGLGALSGDRDRRR